MRNRESVLKVDIHCLMGMREGKDSPRKAYNLKNLSLQKYIQSNLCTSTTHGTRKKWSLFRGGRYSEGQTLP
jgi:hypothetical protein